MPLFGKGKSSDPVSLLKAGDFKGAIKLLEKKLQQNPNDFTTRLRLAEAYEGAGRKDEAAKIYREEGESSLSGGTRAQGIALLRKAAKLKPDDAALAARVSSLEGGGGQSGSTGSFSFDMDAGEEASPEVPAEPSQPEDSSPEVPVDAPPLPAAEPEVAPTTPVPEPPTPDVDVEISEPEVVEDTPAGSSPAKADEPGAPPPAPAPEPPTPDRVVIIPEPEVSEETAAGHPQEKPPSQVPAGPSAAEAVEPEAPAPAPEPLSPDQEIEITEPEAIGEIAVEVPVAVPTDISEPEVVEAIPVEAPAVLSEGDSQAGFEAVGPPAEAPEGSYQPAIRGAEQPAPQEVPAEPVPATVSEIESAVPTDDEVIEDLPLEAIDALETPAGESSAEGPPSKPAPEGEDAAPVEISEETPAQATGALPTGPPRAEAGETLAPLSRLMRPDDPGALMQELFPGITAQEASELGATLKPRQLATGETLIREGETGDSLFLVMAGSLEASGRFEGSALRLALLGRCDVIGEVAFLKDVPRTATVLALEPSVVVELSREIVATKFQDRPDLLGRLEGILEERVANTIRALKGRWKDT